MKVKVTHLTAPKRTYPYLGISALNIIVLFLEPGKGIQMAYESAKLGGIREVGDFCSTIVESNFIPFDGELTLSN